MRWTRSSAAQGAAIGIAAAVTLAACSDGDSTDNATPTGPPPEPVTLTLATPADPGLEALTQQYMEEYPHVTIELVTDELTAHHESLQQDLIAESGAPHIATVDEEFITSFVAQSGGFVNLLDLGADEYEDGYLEWQWARAATVDGSSVIGLGADVGGLALCYRRDLFEQAGLPVDRDGVNEAIGDTWEGFIALGQEYNVATDNAFIDNATSLNAPALAQDAVGYYNRDNELTMEPTETAFRVALSTIEARLSANLESWSEAWNAGFSNGDFAVVACPAWMSGHIQSQVEGTDFEGQWDVADLPGPGGNWGGSWYTIPDQFDENTTDEAYQLIEWLIDADQQLADFGTDGNLPARPAVYDDPAIQEYTDPFLNDAPVGQIFTASVTEIPGPAYHGPKHHSVRRAVENILNEVQAGSIAIEDAWEAAVEAAQTADEA